MGIGLLAASAAAVLVCIEVRRAHHRLPLYGKRNNPSFFGINPISEMPSVGQFRQHSPERRTDGSGQIAEAVEVEGRGFIHNGGNA